MNGAVSIAIIGCGWAGTRHAQAFNRCGATIKWAIDVDSRKTVDMAADFPEVRVSDDYQDALDDPEVDAVDICLPHNLHAEVGIEAARAGKHVLCEKPLAATLEEADRMIEAAEQAGVTLMVAENVRFNPLLQKIQGLLEDGIIGRPALLQVTREAYLTQSFLEDRRWFLDARAAAGGIMMSGGVHDFESARMLLGEVESVYAIRARQRFTEMEGDDTSVATVRFRDASVGVFVESFVMKSLETASGPEVHAIRIDGDLGSLSSEDGRSIRIFSERDDLRVRGDLAMHEIHVPQANTFELVADHFLESLRAGTDPLTSGRSQRKPLEVVLAAYRSMETGQPEPLS